MYTVVELLMLCIYKYYVSSFDTFIIVQCPIAYCYCCFTIPYSLNFWVWNFHGFHVSDSENSCKKFLQRNFKFINRCKACIWLEARPRKFIHKNGYSFLSRTFGKTAKYLTLEKLTNLIFWGEPHTL